MLSKEQSETAKNLLRKYIDSSSLLEDEALDDDRKKAIPEIRKHLDDFLSGRIKVLELNRTSETLSRKFDLWGFKSFSGQMFFNMLYHSAQAQGKIARFQTALMSALAKPSDLDGAKSKIHDFVTLVDDLKNGAAGNRKLSPNRAFTNYFLSYFWQIQAHEIFPVFYKSSMVDTMVSLEFLLPVNDPSDYYEAFYNLNYDLKALYEAEYKDRPVNLWFVERVFWNYYQSQEEEQEDKPEKGVDQKSAEADAKLRAELLAKLRGLDPRDFETLCVRLLQKMGYGDFSSDSGRVTGKPGDKGIDGVIMADKLGFESVYMQAKRYNASQKIGDDQIRNFVGSIDGKKGNRGVFISTSSFTDSAIRYAEERGSNIKVVLIDGEHLTKHMVEYKLGVKVQKTVEVKEIDDGFFDSLKPNTE